MFSVKVCNVALLFIVNNFRWREVKAVLRGGGSDPEHLTRITDIISVVALCKCLVCDPNSLWTDNASLF